MPPAPAWRLLLPTTHQLLTPPGARLRRLAPSTPTPSPPSLHRSLPSNDNRLQQILFRGGRRLAASRLLPAQR
ncbi:unnamed protein product [Urochloa humidicola]